jgi:LPS O-antigen subunit length determinant protein (WzzB/FepE family)
VTDKFVKIIVINKQDLFTFDRFVDRIQAQQIHDLKIAENFDEFLADNVETKEIAVEDTSLLLDNYIDTVNTDLDKDRLKTAMRNILIEAQTLEVA